MSGTANNVTIAGNDHHNAVSISNNLTGSKFFDQGPGAHRTDPRITFP
jgi:hypothetical protein